MVETANMQVNSSASITMHDFMSRFADQLEKKVETMLKPLYTVQNDYDDFGSMVEPRPVQREVVKALSAGYRSGLKQLILCAEPGSGKTLMAIWYSRVVKAKATLVVCPPHLVYQWQAEIIKAFPNMRVAIIPDQKLRDLGISNMATLQRIHETKSADYVVISREAIKTDFPTVNHTVRRKTIEDGRTVVATCCPQCFTALDYDTLEAMIKKKTFCPKCGSALFSYTRGQHHGRPSLAKYIQRKMKGFFSLLAADEVHEMSSGDSAQGAVLGKLAGNMATLALTGTLTGGYSSNIFYLAHRLWPTRMLQEGFKHNARTQWVEKYGCLESVHEVIDEDKKRSIGKRREKEVQRERPGISPLVAGVFLIDRTVFLRLSDFAENLPMYNEIPVPCELHSALQSGYEELTKYRDELREANNPARVVSSALQALLAYPDTHTAEAVLDDDEDGISYAVRQAPAVEIPIGETAKEREIVRIAKESKAQGRKVLVFTTQSNKRDLQPRISKLLEQNGVRALVMNRTVSTGKRDEWIKKRTPTIDALICHPRLVSTGMNLIPYTTIIWVDCGYSTYLLRQASRRSFRLVQPSDVIDVYFLYTSGTIQQDCLSLMAKKNEVSLLLEGELNEDSGLAAMADAGGSILSDLAKVLSGKLHTPNPLEVFSRINKLNNKDKVRGKGGVKKLPEPVIVPAIEDVLASQTQNLYVPPELIVNRHGQLALF